MGLVGLTDGISRLAKFASLRCPESRREAGDPDHPTHPVTEARVRARSDDRHIGSGVMWL